MSYTVCNYIKGFTSSTYSKFDAATSFKQVGKGATKDWKSYKNAEETLVWNTSQVNRFIGNRQ